MKYFVENSSSTYKDEIEKIINTRKEEIFNFFNSKEVELNLNIYIYKDINSLVNGLKERGFLDNPSYMCACQKDEDNSLNFFEPKDNPTGEEWSKEEYKLVIFHELIHAIQFNMFGSTYEWLSEGIAKYLDGTYNKGVKHLINNGIDINNIPPQKELENEFGKHNYNSYDYAYIMVSYLIETLGKDKFINLLKDKKWLDEIKNNLLDKAIKYYKLNI